MSLTLEEDQKNFLRSFEICNPNLEKASHAVLAERLNQFRKFGAQEHGVFKWAAILVEEVGEFTKAALQHEDHRYDKEKTDAMLEKAIHAAAVAMHIVEWLMGQPFEPVTFPDEITWADVMAAWVSNRKVDAIDLDHQESGWFEITFINPPRENVYTNLRFRYKK